MTVSEFKVAGGCRGNLDCTLGQASRSACGGLLSITIVRTLAQAHSHVVVACQVLVDLDRCPWQIVCAMALVSAWKRHTSAERKQVTNRLVEELQAEVEESRHDTAADMEYVNAFREPLGREPVRPDLPARHRASGSHLLEAILIDHARYD